jgi:uncharacterized protein (DUF3084 family)
VTGVCAPIPNPDRMTYLVRVNYRGCMAWAEREDSDTDRATTIDHIRSGNLSHVVTVLECNPVEGTCRDVTEDILAAAEQARIDRQTEPPSLETSLERLRAMLIDHDRDERKHDVGIFGWPS